MFPPAEAQRVPNVSGNPLMEPALYAVETPEECDAPESFTEKGGHPGRKANTSYACSLVQVLRAYGTDTHCRVTWEEGDSEKVSCRK